MSASSRASAPPTTDSTSPDDSSLRNGSPESTSDESSVKDTNDEAVMASDERFSNYTPTWTKTYNIINPFTDSSHGIVNLGTDDCIITIDVRSVVYKTEPLEEIMNSEFKSY